MYLFCSPLVSFLFAQNFSGVSHMFSVVCQKDNGLLTTYLFQRKTENFTWSSTGHGRHIEDVCCKALCILNKYPLERRLVGPRAGLDDVSSGGFLFSVVIDHCFLMENCDCTNFFFHWYYIPGWDFTTSVCKVV